MTTRNEASIRRSAELARRLQGALGAGYLVERELGAGGMAVVFLVRDIALKRKLAVKVVSPDLISSPTILERFQREAETVAQLSHPHIVPLHFVGTQDDLFYIAMEYIDGGSLDARSVAANGELMAVEDVRRAMREVASALAHAHRHGVVHRDIKPQNVLVDAESGRCLVTDFGIARTVDGTSLTSTGMLMGTPAYLAPEQVSGEPSDHRADLYSLGVMSYELITGRQPFEAPTPSAMLMKRLGSPPDPVGKVRPDVPRDLQDVISGCLAPDPAERFQSAADVVRALEAGAKGGTGETTAQFVRKARMRWRLRIALIGSSVMLAVVAVTLFVRRKQPEPALRVISQVDSGMALIAGGFYIIGSDSGALRSRPAHRVRIEPFGIDVHEVTVGEYSAFAEATGAPRPWIEARSEPSWPVTRVQWAEAANYCGWKHPDGGKLPSEEQWEAAARGPTGRPFPWGATFRVGAANTASVGRNAPAPVASFPLGATPEGVHDLIGNVWEWTRSPMRSYPEGQAMPDSLERYYVIRGGAYNAVDAVSTPWFRGYNRPATSRDDLELTGFRCVMPTRKASGDSPRR